MEFRIRQITGGDVEFPRKVGETLCFLKKEYPGFLTWYNTKVLPELNTSRRTMFIAHPLGDEDCIAGIMILKNTREEKKICSLVVLEEYRSHKIGTKLFQCASEVLDVATPVITVSAGHCVDFEGIFKKFGYTAYDRYPGYYRAGVDEISYNGPIEPRTSKKAANV